MSDILAPKTIQLEEAITHNNQTYKSIIFNRKMKGKDMLAADAVQGNQRKEFAILASMAGVPMQVFLEMSIDDLASVQEAAIPFMGKQVQRKLAQIKTETPEKTELS